MSLPSLTAKESACISHRRPLRAPRLARCSLSRPRTAPWVSQACADRQSSHVPKATLRLSDAAVGACALASATLACLGWGDGALAAAVAPDSNPYVEGKTIRLGVTADETIRACPGNVNPNCVSTASTNELYSPAWRAKTRNALEAAEAIERTFLALYPESELAQSATYGYGEYRAFTVPSLFGKDVVEFLIKDESVNNRNWEGDSEGPFVTYRSLAGSVKYVWPIQQPISDFGAQKTRMAAIREQLGWQVIGCELIECYAY